MDKQSIIDKINSIKAELQKLVKEIRELPGNPNATSLGKGCFTIKLSELIKHDKWGPEFHIFEAQYNIIAELLEEWPIQRTIQHIEEAIKKEHIYHQSNWIHLHPEVVKNLKGLIE